ncbi:MAG: magnesium transporter [Oscillospiraceae bacterium]|nr:magnesium transporter [Oscillospiraceae bacterium]
MLRTDLADFDFEERYEELATLVNQKQLRTVRDTLRDWPEVDIAWFLEELSPEKAVLVFRMLPKELAAEVFANLEADRQLYFVNAITESELSAIIEELAIDDAVDMLEELPANVVHRVLKVAQPETRSLLNKFMKYPDNSAGSIMTAEFVELKPDMSIKTALNHIRKNGADSETIYTCYVIDKARHLTGVVTAKQLLLAGIDQTIGEIMDENVIYCTTADEQETVTQLFSKYGFISLPVVDGENRLVGIVTVDDVITVMEDAATEDMEMMAAITPSEKDYLHTGVWETWKQRIPWLLILMLSATFTQAIINSFETALAACVVLTAYIPMLMGTGGNCSSQSSVTVIRSLSLGDIEFRDLLRVLWKELRVSVLCGLTLAVVNFGKLMLLDRLTVTVAAVVSLTLLFTIVVAKLVGGVLPMLAKKLKLDPAVMASPFITTIVDAVSLLIYFRFASLLLGV